MKQLTELISQVQQIDKDRLALLVALAAVVVVGMAIVWLG